MADKLPCGHEHDHEHTEACLSQFAAQSPCVDCINGSGCANATADQFKATISTRLKLPTWAKNMLDRLKKPEDCALMVRNRVRQLAGGQVNRAKSVKG